MDTTGKNMKNTGSSTFAGAAAVPYPSGHLAPHTESSPHAEPAPNTDPAPQRPVPGDASAYDGILLRPSGKDPGLSDEEKYIKLSSGTAQTKLIASLMKKALQEKAGGAASGAYSVSFPDGIGYALLKAEPGSTKEALYSMLSLSGQYYLNHITSGLPLARLGIWAIYKYLYYKEENTRLMAEFIFVKNALRNFGTAMLHDDRRQAMLTGLAETQKTAADSIFDLMQRMEELRLDRQEDAQVFSRQARQSVVLNDRLFMARELYLVSCLMEMFLSAAFWENSQEHFTEEMERFITFTDWLPYRSFEAFYNRLKTEYEKESESGSEAERNLAYEVTEEHFYKYYDQKNFPVSVALRKAAGVLRARKEIWILPSGVMYVNRVDQSITGLLPRATEEERQAFEEDLRRETKELDEQEKFYWGPETGK